MIPLYKLMITREVSTEKNALCIRKQEHKNPAGAHLLEPMHYGFPASTQNSAQIQCVISGAILGAD
jgi:hypothetical protein